MLLGAIGAVVAFGIATLILYLWKGQGTARIFVAFVAAAAVSIVLCFIAAAALLGHGAIPVAGIPGAIIGALAPCVPAWKKAKAPPAGS